MAGQLRREAASAALAPCGGCLPVLPPPTSPHPDPLRRGGQLSETKGELPSVALHVSVHAHCLFKRPEAHVL